MLVSAAGADERIVGRYGRSGAQCGLHQPGGAGTGAARAARWAACAGARSARAKASYAAAGCSLDDAGIHAAKKSSGLRAENVCICDGKIVASDGQVEIVFEREVDGIFQ